MIETVEEKKKSIETERADAEEFAKEYKNLEKEEQTAVKNIMIGMNSAKKTKEYKRKGGAIWNYRIR